MDRVLTIYDAFHHNHLYLLGSIGSHANFLFLVGQWILVVEFPRSSNNQKSFGRLLSIVMEAKTSNPVVSKENKGEILD